MGSYSLSRKAIADLEEIWMYPFTTWSEKQADVYFELLTGAFVTICKQPRLGKPYETIHEGLYGIRVGQHIIFYRSARKDHIHIIRILHIRMDIISHL